MFVLYVPHKIYHESDKFTVKEFMTLYLCLCLVLVCTFFETLFFPYFFVVCFWLCRHLQAIDFKNIIIIIEVEEERTITIRMRTIETIIIIIVKCTYTYDIEHELHFLYISGMPRLWVQTMLPVSIPNLTWQLDSVRVDRRTVKKIKKLEKNTLFYCWWQI